jgi:hypothetical protein
MAYTLTNLQDDIRNYTEVDDSVLSNTILTTIIKNAENRIYRDADSDDNRFYATSNLQAGNRYVTIPSDLRFIRYVQLKDSSGNQVFLEKRDTSFMAEYYDTPGTQSGLPKYYGNWDANFWVVIFIKYLYIAYFSFLSKKKGPVKGPLKINTSIKY